MNALAIHLYLTIRHINLSFNYFGNFYRIIAFSSRSFEYYLLLHFEYLYRSFLQTECGERVDGNKHIFECGTGKIPEKDCNGAICINGYARTRGYWMETKSGESTFPLVKDKLIKGMVNACRLRSESDAKTAAPVYERNPYTDVDRLVGRLIGKYTVPFGTKQRICESGTDWTIELSSQGVEIDNHSDRAILLSRGQFTVYDWEKEDVLILNETPILIQPHDKCILDCCLDKTKVISIKLSTEKEILLLPKYES